MSVKKEKIKSEVPGITVIGTGNLAWHICNMFYNKNASIDAIIGRNTDKAAELALAFGCQHSDAMKDIPENSTFIIIAVSDSKIKEVASQLKNSKSVILHTSGSIPMSVFEGYASRYGVLYPFQTFSRDIELDYADVPFCIEASDQDTLRMISDLACIPGRKVIEMNSEKRSRLHISGIVINNFVNYLTNLTCRFMNKQGLDRELIIPLLTETVRKISLTGPEKAQTGPARRKELEIIRSHLKILHNYPELKFIYRALSESIIDHYYSD